MHQTKTQRSAAHNRMVEINSIREFYDNYNGNNFKTQ